MKLMNRAKTYCGVFGICCIDTRPPGTGTWNVEFVSSSHHLNALRQLFDIQSLTNTPVNHVVDLVSFSIVLKMNF
jgi:hypothetical protein